MLTTRGQILTTHGPTSQEVCLSRRCRGRSSAVALTAPWHGARGKLGVWEQCRKRRIRGTYSRPARTPAVHRHLVSLQLNRASATSLHPSPLLHILIRNRGILQSAYLLCFWFLRACFCSSRPDHWLAPSQSCGPVCQQRESIPWAHQLILKACES